ncbi:hypothetical protein RF11_10107 [Thelohanellus kitauei]|uniref:Uncharacterized protein n=1 Tax=Thelohanellus kitauei TaxID=669202 RepID=A0A0C2JKH0_THEKT|nr:hypothetical protein RF11_10107 [Thelohanellus kitauei]
MMKPEFVIEMKQYEFSLSRQQAKSTKVFQMTETELSIDFDIELYIRGLYDDDGLLYAAKLSSNEKIDIKVISFSISSFDCEIDAVDHDARDPQDVKKLFLLLKANETEHIHLSVVIKVNITTNNDFYFILKIEPRIGSESLYSLQSILAYETTYTYLVALKLRRREIGTIIAATLGSFLLFLGMSVLVFLERRSSINLLKNKNDADKIATIH